MQVIQGLFYGPYDPANSIRVLKDRLLVVLCMRSQPHQPQRIVLQRYLTEKKHSNNTYSHKCNLSQRSKARKTSPIQLTTNLNELLIPL